MRGLLLLSSTVIRPWTVKIFGESDKPGDYHFEDLINPHTLEDRVYRLVYLIGILGVWRCYR